MDHQDAAHSPLARLRALLDGFRVAMVVTFDRTNRPHARPMHLLLETAVHPHLVFMTDATSDLAIEVQNTPQVLVTLSDESGQKYVSIEGNATVQHDPARARDLWSMQAQAWWPAGPEDPNLALITVRAETVEFWEGPSKLSYSLSLVSALLNDKRIAPHGEHGTFHVPPT